MDKRVLKEFSIMARMELRRQVTRMANSFGVDKDKDGEIEVGNDYVKINNKTYPRSYEGAYRKLIEVKREKGFNELIEEVAYTWFNRFIALRFMEVNDYLPSHIRVLSSETEGKVDPDILEEYEEADLDIDIKEISKIINIDKNLELAYRKLLIAQCNKLSKMMPFLFEEIDDYTEMLLPDKLLIPESIIKKLVSTISEEDFKEEVEIIGWIYQYYIAEKKDEVFADLKKNIKITKENIPAATQLFTPKWIVKYMVENSLGRLWLEGHQNEELQRKWKYYLEESQQEPEVEIELQRIREEHAMLRPEDIKVLDPCMGSGHILVYAFDVLYEIYKTAGYSEREIPKLILEKNLYGLDIDDRASQLASFALIMKARQYNKRLFREIERENLELNLCSIQESNAIEQEAIEYFCSLETGLDNKELQKDLEYLVTTFTDAKEYGSILEVEEVNFEALKQRLNEVDEFKVKANHQIDSFQIESRKIILEKLPDIIKQAEIICDKFEACITNPPYMGRKGMNEKLIKLVDNIFSKTKQDLFSIFIERCTKFLKEKAISAMITQHSWMFLSSYSSFRAKFYVDNDIINMAHLGARAFEEIDGEVVQSTSFVFRKNNIKQYKGVYKRLVNYNNSREKEEQFLGKYNDIFTFNIEKAENLPGKLLAYWLEDELLKLFLEKEFNTYYISEGQNKTGNNDRFLRFAWEVIDKNIGIGEKWRYYAKGGGYRKWYGNLDNIINWSEEARLHYRKDNVCRIVPEYLTNRKGITWGLITTNQPSFRILPEYATFDVAGTSVFFDDYTKYNYFLGFLNSKISSALLGIINPTVSLQLINVGSLPIIFGDMEFQQTISENVEKCIALVKWDWDNKEISKGFKTNILVYRSDESNYIKDIYENRINMYNKKSQELLKEEEEINDSFIKLYKLTEVMNKNIKSEESSINKGDYGFLIKDFIHYFIGCVFGRYSIDAEGLIYAGGDFNEKWDLDNKKVRKIEKDEDGNIISDSWVDATFMPNRDNVIPITDNEYFEDDIVSRFVDFVRTVYSDESLEENLDFIAETLVKKGDETSRDRIRRYFMDEFYKDHCKVYQKRPIYWLVDSGKNKGFKALLYLHRYNKETLSNIRLNYLLELQGKYINEEKQVERYLDSETITVVEKKKRAKQLQILSQKQTELLAFDKILDELANKEIELDLDDGVVVNYEQLQLVLAKIK